MEGTPQPSGSDQYTNAPDQAQRLLLDYPALEHRATELREQLAAEGLVRADLIAVLAHALLDATHQMLNSARRAVNAAAHQRVGHDVGVTARARYDPDLLAALVERCHERHRSTTSIAVMLEQLAIIAAIEAR